MRVLFFVCAAVNNIKYFARVIHGDGIRIGNVAIDLFWQWQET